MRHVFVAIILLASATATAAPHPEIARAKALLDKQSAAIAKYDADKFLATFVASPFVIFPGANAIADDEAAVRKLFRSEFAGGYSDGTNGVGGATWEHVHVVALGAGEGAVASGDLTVSWAGGDEPTTFRVTELLVANPENQALAVLAAQFSMSVPERQAVANAADTKFRAAAMPGASDNADAAKLIEQPARAAAALLADPDVIVLGTETKERAVGAPAAKKLLTAWKSLKLAVVGGVRTGSIGESGLGYFAANATLTAKKQVLPFRVLVFVRENPQTGEPTVLAIHFSSPAFASN